MHCLTYSSHQCFEREAVFHPLSTVRETKLREVKCLETDHMGSHYWNQVFDQAEFKACVPRTL